MRTRDICGRLLLESGAATCVHTMPLTAACGRKSHARRKFRYVKITSRALAKPWYSSNNQRVQSYTSNMMKRQFVVRATIPPHRSSVTTPQPEGLNALGYPVARPMLCLNLKRILKNVTPAQPNKTVAQQHRLHLIRLMVVNDVCSKALIPCLLEHNRNANVGCTERLASFGAVRKTSHTRIPHVAEERRTKSKK